MSTAGTVVETVVVLVDVVAVASADVVDSVFCVQPAMAILRTAARIIGFIVALHSEDSKNAATAGGIR